MRWREGDSWCSIKGSLEFLRSPEHVEIVHYKYSKGNWMIAKPHALDFRNPRARELICPFSLTMTDFTSTVHTFDSRWANIFVKTK